MEKSFSKIAIFFLALIFVFACRNEPAISGAYKALDNLKPETVTVRLRSNPASLNPWFATSRYSMHVVNHIHPYMVNFDPFTGEFKPTLVKSRAKIDRLPDDDPDFPEGVSYTYEIKDEATWDDGKPVTAYDYVFSLKALFNPKVNAARYRAGLQANKDVRIDPNNPKKFSVIQDKYYMTGEEVTGTYIYPEHIYDPKGLMKDFKLKDLSNPKMAAELVEKDPRILEFADYFNDSKLAREKEFVSGCGAYELEEWVTGERIVLKRKENWWGDKLNGDLPVYLKAYPKRIIYKPIEDVNATIALLKEGTLDAATEINPPKVFYELTQNEEANKFFHFYKPLARNYFMYSLNNSSPKLSDKRVRRALAHLLDLDFAIEKLSYGQAIRIKNTFMPDEETLNTELPLIDFNIEKAKTLLAEAGWKDSNNNGVLDKTVNGEFFELEFQVHLTASSELLKSVTTLWQEQAKKVGVKIEMDIKDFNVLRKEVKSKNYEISLWGSGRLPGPQDLSQYWHSKNNVPNGGNITGFSNERTDALIDQINSTIDEKERIPLYKEFQEILFEEQPAIFLFTSTNGTVIHKRFDTAAKASSIRPGFFENAFLLSNTNNN